MKVKTLIIGAGPSGLCLASTLKDKDFLILEKGKRLEDRDRNSPVDSVCGAGGAGFYSDGKFSFYPAGTATGLWPEELLEQAHQRLQDDLQEFLQVPDVDFNEKFVMKPGWNLKEYPSFYVGLEERKRMIQKFVDRIPEGKILYETEFSGIMFRHDDTTLCCHIFDLKTQEHSEIMTENVVFANGRFGPLDIQYFQESKSNKDHLVPSRMPKIFKRFEYGMRVCFPSNAISKTLTDPKYIKQEPWGEIRTFCWCEKGEVTCTNFNQICSYSGRSDCPPTGIDNFGFNIRIKERMPQSTVHEILTSTPVFHTKNLSEVSKRYGQFENKIEDAFRAFMQFYPDFRELYEQNQLSFVGPTFEGVGEYLDIDNITLQARTSVRYCSAKVYCLGDCTGILRGIIPSMLSGYYLALRLENPDLQEL